MGLQIRDERQLKALTGLSQAQVDHLLPVFSEVYMEKAAAKVRRRGRRRSSNTQTWRGRQRQTAHYDRQTAVRPLLLQDVSHV